MYFLTQEKKRCGKELNSTLTSSQYFSSSSGFLMGLLREDLAPLYHSECCSAAWQGRTSSWKSPMSAVTADGAHSCGEVQYGRRERRAACNCFHITIFLQLSRTHHGDGAVLRIPEPTWVPELRGRGFYRVWIHAGGLNLRQDVITLLGGNNILTPRRGVEPRRWSPRRRCSCRRGHRQNACARTHTDK